MSPPSRSSSLADILAGCPGAARVFERYRIDYWCRADRSLAEAARDTHTPLETLVAELAHVPHEEEHVRVHTLNGPMLAAHIIERHEAIMDEVERLARIADRAEGESGTLVARAVRHLLAHYAAELTRHVASARALLDRIFAAGPLPWNAIQGLRQSHLGLAEFDPELRRLTSDFTPPDDAGPAVVALWRGIEALHMAVHALIHLERNVLLDKALDQTQERPRTYAPGLLTKGVRGPSRSPRMRA